MFIAPGATSWTKTRLTQITIDLLDKDTGVRESSLFRNITTQWTKFERL